MLLNRHHQAPRPPSARSLPPSPALISSLTSSCFRPYLSEAQSFASGKSAAENQWDPPPSGGQLFPNLVRVGLPTNHPESLGRVERAAWTIITRTHGTQPRYKTRSLRDSIAAGRGRHGRSVSRPRHAPRPYRRREDSADTSLLR